MKCYNATSVRLRILSINHIYIPGQFLAHLLGIYISSNVGKKIPTTSSSHSMEADISVEIGIIGTLVDDGPSEDEGRRVDDGPEDTVLYAKRPNSSCSWRREWWLGWPPIVAPLPIVAICTWCLLLWSADDGGEEYVAPVDGRSWGEGEGCEVGRRRVERGQASKILIFND